jgi:hypothetical protein
MILMEISKRVELDVLGRALGGVLLGGLCLEAPAMREAIKVGVEVVKSHGIRRQLPSFRADRGEG